MVTGRVDYRASEDLVLGELGEGKSGDVILLWSLQRRREFNS